MDWKAHYRDEVRSAAGRRAVADAVARHARGDGELTEALLEGGVLSFPHTTLRDSADPIARVAAAVADGPFEGVVALGVLHTGALPEAERALAADLSRGGRRAHAAFERLGGAFVAGGDLPGFRRDDDLVANEFSLDLFDAVLAATAAERGVAVPPVLHVYVGPTRDPDETFATAHDVAAPVQDLLDQGFACVATGDLVHFGHGYSSPEEIRALPADPAALERHFAGRLRTMLDAALVRGDHEGAYVLGSDELRSDQRHVLPVIGALLGEGARADVLSFRLSDYSEILHERPPCLVGAALVAYRRAADADSDDDEG